MQVMGSDRVTWSLPTTKGPRNALLVCKGRKPEIFDNSVNDYYIILLAHDTVLACHIVGTQ